MIKVFKKVARSGKVFQLSNDAVYCYIVECRVLESEIK